MPADVDETRYICEVRMTAHTVLNRQRRLRLTLAMLVQASLYTLLGTLILWAIYFFIDRAVRDSISFLGHRTLSVSCY